MYSSDKKFRNTIILLIVFCALALLFGKLLELTMTSSGIGEEKKEEEITEAEKERLRSMIPPVKKNASVLVAGGNNSMEDSSDGSRKEEGTVHQPQIKKGFIIPGEEREVYVFEKLEKGAAFVTVIKSVEVEILDEGSFGAYGYTLVTTKDGISGWVRSDKVRTVED